MDRQIIYPGQIAVETDLLNTNRNTMIAIGKLAGALFGTGGVTNGLVVGPSSPAALTVDVAPGEIYQLENVDNTDYSSLPADTTDAILKQGIMLAKQTLACAAPATAGYSINYLIQAAYQDSDTGAVALPYYNASNPAQAYSGPNNTGATQATKRAGIVVLNAKAGTAATTGTQTTPAADSGYLALASVTVANGQATITSGNITAIAPATPPMLDTSAIYAELASTGTGKGAAMVGFLQAGTGAVARTSLDKLRESVSVKDFGAVGDGVADDTAAVLACITGAIAQGANNAPTIVWPSGTYKITNGWTQPTWINHVSSGRVTIDASGYTGSADFIVVKNEGYVCSTYRGSTGWNAIFSGAAPFTIIGPSATSACACFAMGNTTAQSETSKHVRGTGLENVQVTLFGIGLRIVPNDFYINRFVKAAFISCKKPVLWDGTTTNSGENIVFTECDFTGGASGFFINGSCDLKFNDCTFDFNCESAIYFDTNASYVNVFVNGGHMEGTTSAGAIVSSGASVGDFCIVQIDGVTIFPTTLASAASAYGYTFPSPGTRADGGASFCKFVKQPPSGFQLSVSVGGGTVVELPYLNSHPQESFPSGGYPRIDNMVFRAGYMHDFGVVFAKNQNPTFVGGTDGGAISALAGWGSNNSGYTSVLQSSTKKYSTDPVSIAFVGPGSGYAEVVSTKFNANGGDEFTVGLLVYGGTSAAGTIYTLVRFFNAAGTDITGGGSQTNTLDSIYLDASQPDYNGSRDYWIRWPFQGKFIAPPGTVSALVAAGTSGVNGTIYMARPYALKLR